MAALRLTAPTQGLLPGHRIGGKARARLAAAPASALHARGPASSPQGGSSRSPLLPLGFGWVSRFMSPSTVQESAGGPCPPLTPHALLTQPPRPSRPPISSSLSVLALPRQFQSLPLFYLLVRSKRCALAAVLPLQLVISCPLLETA